MPSFPRMLAILVTLIGLLTHPAMLHAGMNPDFFKGTVVERDVAALLDAR